MLPDRESVARQHCLEALVGTSLAERGWTLAIAESCTGGLVCHRLTNVPGSSAYILGGVISYSDAAKERVLGVSAETLAAHGAVSPDAAKEMARGTRRLLGADVGLAVTGIAGPGGGTHDKPVGLVFLHLSALSVDMARRHVWAGGRVANKAQSAEAALQLLHDYLLTEERRPRPESSL